MYLGSIRQPETAWDSLHLRQSPAIWAVIALNASGQSL